MGKEIVKYYDSNSNVMAFLIPAEYQCEGINFVTDNSQYQQVATMQHKSGHIILPHYHNIIKREIDLTNETLVIRKGVLVVTLYDNQKPIHVFEVKTGDVLTLCSGGHGFEVKEDVDMVEIKQGPFLGDKDKTRF